MLELVLHSPANGDPCVYYWPIDEKAKGEGAVEIIETIKWVCDDFPEMKLALDNCILSGCDVKSYESMKIVCDRYNRVIDSVRQMRAGTSLPVAVPTRPSPGLLRHIIQKAYNHAVTEPDKLNNYEPFSPEVYGETSYEFISQMIDQIPITENDVFIDLGSGVGQVVLQVAASTKAKKCIGIERAEVPAIYAHELEKSFQFWMRWYGKIYGDYELIKGDFFEEKHKELITNASFIFVNNFAFGPNVDHMLKLRFADLRDGARIVSSKSFCPLNFRITDRNLSDIATIMHVREIQPNIKGSVSWTGKPVSYYHHIIDRRKLEDYFLNMRGAKKHNNHQNNSNNNNNNNANANANANANVNANNNKDSANNVNNTTNTNINHHNKYNEESDHLRPAKVNNSNTNSNDSSSSDDSKDEKIKDENYFGPTTRKAWSEWCNSRYRDNSNSNSNQSSNGNTQLTSSSETGYHSESQVKSHANGTNRPGRPRKYSPGVSAVVRRATKNKANSSGRRRPGRPRKDGIKISKKPKKAVNFNGLDLLHAQTVLSISNSAGVRTEPAPGCIDQKLDSVKRSEIPPQSDANKSYGLGFGQMRNSIMDAVKSFDSNNANVKPTLTDIDTKSNTLKPTETSLSETSIDKKDYPKQEKAIVDFKIEESENKPLNTAHNFEDYQYLMESVSSSLDVLFEDYKRQYMSLLLYMQTPKYKNELVAEVDMEKRKHSNLLAQVDLLERTVNNLRDKGVNLLKTRLGELDIVASTSEELVTRAKEIVCRNKELQEQVYMYQEQVNYLDNLNNALKKHKSYDTLINVNQIKAQNEPQVMQPVNVVLAKPPSTSETVNRTEINASEQVDQNSMMKPNDNQLRQQVQQNSVQTPLSNDYQCNSNNTLDSCRLINIEERMKKMIVAALNDKAGVNQPSKPVKKESRKRSSTKTSNLKATKAASRCDGVYDFEEDEPPSVRPETDYPSRLKDSSKLGPIKDVSITASTTGQSTKATDARSTNKATNASNNPPNEDKKPILLTFKIDRRDNSAIVTSPAISPEKSPSKSPKDTEVHIKRKHLSPERVKKSRSPKYSSIVPETNGSEKRTSLIIKLNHSSIHITSNHNHEKSESSINRDSNLKTDKPLDGSNKPLTTTTVPSNRSHHGLANGSHKWQATISNSFDKLVKLAHQLDPPKEELPPTMVVEKSILKATLKRKRSQKPSDSQKVKQSFYAFEESSTAKTPPDTPPQTPSPSDSLERPLTPQTPPGLTPASDGMTSINQHNHRSKETKSLPSSINSRSRVEPTPAALQENGSTSDQTTTNLKVRKVGRPPKKSMPIMWNKSVEQANNSTMDNSALNLINFANQADRLNDSSLKSSMNHESYNKHSINEPKGETNNSMNVQITSLPHYHHQQALFNHQFMQTNKSMDLHMNKNNQNSMKFTSPMNGDYSPLSVPISSIAQHQVQNGYGSSLDFSPQAFHPSFSPPDNNYNKLHRKLSLDESSTSSSLSKCYSQKKLLRPSRLDAVCKRDYNTAIKQYT